MTQSAYAARAYRVAASRRSPREQEAELFRLINARLQAARDQGLLARVRASCDNRRLWRLVVDLAGDPANQLPTELRASIVSVGLAVHRELDSGNPNFDVLIAINEAMAAGLSQSTP